MSNTSFNFVNPIGPGNVTDVLSSMAFPEGMLAKASNPNGGEAEFIFLPGVANCVAGSVVIYDTSAAACKLAVAGDRGPAAVAMAAVGAGSYGWFQIRGFATIKETGATAGGNVYLTATAGIPSVTTVAGDKVDGMRFKSANGTPGAGYAYTQILYPSLNGNG